MPTKKTVLISLSVLAGIALILAAVYGILWYREYSRTLGLDPADYVTVVFSGYDTLGTAELQFDEERFTEDFLKYSRNPSKKKLEAAGLSEYYRDSIAEKVSFRLSEDEELKNGQKIYVYMNYNEDAWDLFHVKAERDVFTVTVRGLTDLISIDLFYQDVTNFSGMSPYLTLTLSPYERYGLVVNFEADKNENIACGESITVSAGVTARQLAERGYVADSLSHVYTAPLTDSYITSPGQISDSLLSAMQNAAEEEIVKYDKYSVLVSLTDITYAGVIVCYPKELSLTTGTNHVYVVYRATASASGKDWSPETVYLPVEFRKVISYAAGTQSYETENGIQGTTDLSLGWFAYVRGYTDAAGMVEDLSSSLLGNYDYSLSSEIKNLLK